MRNRSGFTLIEMLLATVLTSVLMVGVLAVITRVSRPISIPIHEASLTSISMGTDAVFRVVTADLAQAREVKLDGSDIALTGFGGLDPVTRERNQRPVHMRYRVQQVADQSWLVREERMLDDGSQVVTIELVAPGVSGIALEPPALQLADGVAGLARPVDGDFELPMDGRWRLRLWMEGAQDVIDRPVILQRGLSQ